MIVNLKPNLGVHEVTCERITFKTAKTVDDHIRYLRTIRKMLWRGEQKKVEPK